MFLPLERYIAWLFLGSHKCDPLSRHLFLVSRWIHRHASLVELPVLSGVRVAIGLTLQGDRCERDSYCLSMCLEIKDRL